MSIEKIKNTEHKLKFFDIALQAIADKLDLVEGRDRDKEEGVVTAQGLLEEVKKYLKSLEPPTAEIKKEAVVLVKMIMKKYNYFDNNDAQEFIKALNDLGIDIEQTNKDIAAGKFKIGI